MIKRQHEGEPIFVGRQIPELPAKRSGSPQRATSLVTEPKLSNDSPRISQLTPMALRFLSPQDPQSAGHNTPVGKAAELLALGLVVGACSVALSFLWKGYTHRASDWIQYFVTESAWNKSYERLPFRLVFIDIGERTCRQWAKKDYDELCAGMPRFPHAELATIFSSLKRAKPKLVVVDIDLRTEKPGSSPFITPGSLPTPGSSPVRDIDLFTEEEVNIRKSVLEMKNTAFIVAQQLIRQPIEGHAQNYDYRLVATILHGLEKEKDNLRSGQVEQEPGEDGVLRRFIATVELTHPDSVLNPNATDPKLAQHLALRVCELIEDQTLCGRERSGSAKTTTAGPHFGSLPINSKGDRIQFPYSLPRTVGRLGDSGVAVLEARSLLAPSFEMSALDDAIVIFGSTARGRGDYHVTPLDVFGGETAGLVIVANEVVAALRDRWLLRPHWLVIVLEKLGLIIVSTIVVFFGFWYLHFRMRNDDGTSKGLMRRILSIILVSGHFTVVVLAAVLINAVIMWFISVRSYRTGELIDPVTPVVAAILDIVVDVCAMIKEKAASWADQWRSTLSKPV